MNFTKIMSLVDNFNKLSSATTTLEGFADTLSGGSGVGMEIYETLQAIENDIVQGFGDVVTAITDVANQNAWNNNVQSSLGAMYNQIDQFIEDFRYVLINTQTDTYTINGTDFSTYCSNHNLYTVLKSFVELENWGNNYKTLQALVVDKEISNIEGNIIGLWGKIASDVQQNGIAKNLFASSLIGKTQFQLFQELTTEYFKFLFKIAYIHDTALFIERRISPSNVSGISSIIPYINQNFGNNSACWTPFITKIKAFIKANSAANNAQNSIGIMALSQPQYPKAIGGQYAAANGTYCGDGFSYWMNIGRVVADSGSYITSIRLANQTTNPAGNGLNGQNIALEITTCDISDPTNPQQTIGGQTYDSVCTTCIANNNAPNGGGYYISTAFQAKPTGILKNNQMWIVTGVNISLGGATGNEPGNPLLDNQIAIQVQWGRLDLSNLAKPKIINDNIWSIPQNGAYNSITLLMDTRPVGSFSTNQANEVVNNLAVLTNVAFCESTNSCVGLSGEFALPFTECDFMQPANFLPICTSD